jgi:hypothetical protein
MSLLQHTTDDVATDIPGGTPHHADAAPRRLRRPGRLALALVVALSLAGIQAVASGPTDAPTALECESTGGPTCNRLWDRVRVLDIPRGRWATVATAMGLFPRGDWISDDGLYWEHLDGRSFVVAHPAH